MLFCLLSIFLEINFFKKTLSGIPFRMSNSLDPDQAQCFVRPDLGQNYLQDFQQTTKVATGGKRYGLNTAKNNVIFLFILLQTHVMGSKLEGSQ